jgi:hypothetical protein
MRRWVASGAQAPPDPSPRSPWLPVPASPPRKPRSFWSFQPMQPSQSARRCRPGDAVPAIRSTLSCSTSRSTQTEPERSHPDADRVTLLRRRPFGSLGAAAHAGRGRHLPRRTVRPDAYERPRRPPPRSSPRYGERWGRHWLDIAGYADSDGYTADDTPSVPSPTSTATTSSGRFNEDKPIDRFLTEQLAGDELARHSAMPPPRQLVQDPANRELADRHRIPAHGCRRHRDRRHRPGRSPATRSSPTPSRSCRHRSSGLSVGCAQCHDHRYDPIPQADYFRLRAVFEPAYDWKNWRTPGPTPRLALHRRDRPRGRQHRSRGRRLTAEKEAKQTAYIDEALTKHLEKLEPPLREATPEPRSTHAGQAQR